MSTNTLTVSRYIVWIVDAATMNAYQWENNSWLNVFDVGTTGERIDICVGLWKRRSSRGLVQLWWIHQFYFHSFHFECHTGRVSLVIIDIILNLGIKVLIFKLMKSMHIFWGINDDLGVEQVQTLVSGRMFVNFSHDVQFGSTWCGPFDCHGRYGRLSTTGLSVHVRAHGNVGLCSAGCRNLCLGFRGQSQSHVERHATSGRVHFQTWSSSWKRMGYQWHRKKRFPITIFYVYYIYCIKCHE